ncbi:ATP-binding protein [Actinomadura flavalba]|uniref:ATP-binding protein n=1 Tax=Actinomadura flavalba TaxID=1120938 RepID=UPI00035ECC35|nr:BTAD domain-containing putative transcriptional regulator [Actinomadura flavalba]
MVWFGVLGALRVRSDDGAPVAVPEAKVRVLLAALLAAGGRPVASGTLIDDLWGAAPPANPAGALQVKVSRLRRALPGRVRREGGGYRLVLEPGELDAARFADLVADAARAADPGVRADLLTEALALWRGDALADLPDVPSAVPVVVGWEEQRLAATVELAAVRLERGEHAAVAADLAPLTAAHPLHEGLRAAHVRALYRSGRQSEALESLAGLRVRLRDELGVDPGPEITGLYQAILGAAERPAGNLPAPVTSLVGRESAVAEVAALLDDARVVTLTGPGGVGKTRLALASAAGVADGVRLVELSGRDGGGVAAAVAAVLGVRDDVAALPVAERIADALRDRRMLLVLDNCEHVLEAVASLVAPLLRAAPGVRVLATSRAPLDVAGEVLWPVPPLDRDAARRLFVERATAAAPGFVPDDAAIGTVCDRLDGLPLALELAATRVRSMRVTELADRLDDRFALLSTGRRDAPARQRTLRAVIDWSWEPLPAAERAVLRRLAVFAGGCTLSAAEDVCGGTEVLGSLGHLVDRSLVVQSDGRYRLLESVAAYALERLREEGEEEAVRARHRAHYAAFAVEAGRHLRGHGQADRLTGLDAESANVRAALDGAVRAGETARALRMADALAWYWFLRGHLGEAARVLTAIVGTPSGGDEAALRARVRAWLAGVLMLSGRELDPDGRSGEALRGFDGVDDAAGSARAHWFLGYAQWGYGDQEVRVARFRRAEADALAAGDAWGVALARIMLAQLAPPEGGRAALRAVAERSLAVFAGAGDGFGRLQALAVLGRLAEIDGDYAEAERRSGEGVRLARELRLWPEVAAHLAGLGRIALLTGDLDRADDLHERARRLGAETGDKQAEQFADLGLALTARRRGRLDDAEHRLRRWLDWNRSREGAPGVALILAELGFIAELRGDPQAARALHSEGLSAAASMNDPRASALAHEGLAGAAALAGDAGAAASHLARATGLRLSAGAPLPPAEQTDVRRIRAALARL